MEPDDAPSRPDDLLDALVRQDLDPLSVAELDARITGVLVSAAVRADLIARQGFASPSELNRATLAWYQLHHLRRAALLSPHTQRPGGRSTWEPDASRLMA